MLSVDQYQIVCKLTWQYLGGIVNSCFNNEEITVSTEILTAGAVNDHAVREGIRALETFANRNALMVPEIPPSAPLTGLVTKTTRTESPEDE